ncbi:hypothetical protein D9758_000383 [Tetrapyrgos nigripes]|uniref:Glycosyltransferase family 32 protein n=1 Tax=Tetrapyrgos nigripes TaxID=182062 RepID=A0A8H5H1R9_9AGAR|nr:hypothetical protein D9758_000383 [Tetrapyrgos nigripes]
MPSHSPQKLHSRRLSNGLPQYSFAAQEKRPRQQPAFSWLVPVIITLPGRQPRTLKCWVINPFALARCGRKRACLLMTCLVLFALYFTFALTQRFGTKEKRWPRPPFVGHPPTLVFRRDDLAKIWLWEIASGHYPSRQPIPLELGLKFIPDNPSLPPRKRPPLAIAYEASPNSLPTNGFGPKRIYLDIQSEYDNIAYPPRPVSGSIADFDIVMEHCDFSQRKFVRDCLEVLRNGAGLDNGKRLRRGNMDDWKYIFLEANGTKPAPIAPREIVSEGSLTSSYFESPDSSGLTKKPGAPWEPPLMLSTSVPVRSHSRLSTPCDADYPRVFHMFWAGPFTDKPYMALLSFLYTQNCGLHDHDSHEHACRPQFWMWINPGPAASVPNPSATEDMFNELKSNPWASPFLHPRFKNVIRFKLWNTTEQLDGIPELKDEWRSLETLFNSGGRVINVPNKDSHAVSPKESDTETARLSMRHEHDDPIHRTGSKSSASYDRLSVILSDMARFILCHRFGGIYLDADTIILRDWEEVWGWKGAFAYRWSRLERYNTAVLHLNKGSALGTFLFRTALKNDLDFHPITVSRYLKEAYLEGLLLRLPDALFDPAWLNTEYLQRDRPLSLTFQKFFDTPMANSAAPQALGFDGFFKGAYSYHFHNFWWKPFDPSRNWPDLGPRFEAGELKAKSSPKVKASLEEGDRRDLDWSTVLKRTFESYIRGERPNMYGEWIKW